MVVRDWKDWWEGDPFFEIPFYIVTHQPHEAIKKGKTDHLYLCNYGLHAGTCARTKSAAGDKNIGLDRVNIIPQCLKAGWLEEVEYHITRCQFC